VRADEPGAYLVRVAQTLEDASGTDAASRTLGLVSPAADEYRRLGIDADALRGFATAGGGRTIALDRERSEAPSVWTHDIEASAFPTPVWPWLLLVAMLLVPIDVGIRRVALSGADLRRARAWVGRRVGFGRSAPEVVPGLAELRAARERSARRSARQVEPVKAANAPTGPATGSLPPPPRPVRTPAQGPAPETTTSVEPAPDEAEPGAETLAERLARRRRNG
jgi:hypothetical protein